MLLRVCHRGGTADEDGVLPVEPADPFQAPEHIGHMASEDAAIRVKFIDDHVLQIGKKLLPFRVMRQDSRVQHVGIGDDNIPLLADGLTGIVRCVAVVCECLYVGLEFPDETVDLCHLIVGQGFCGEKINGPGFRLLDDPLQYGDVVA